MSGHGVAAKKSASWYAIVGGRAMGLSNWDAGERMKHGPGTQLPKTAGRWLARGAMGAEARSEWSEATCGWARWCSCCFLCDARGEAAVDGHVTRFHKSTLDQIAIDTSTRAVSSVGVCDPWRL